MFVTFSGTYIFKSVITHIFKSNKLSVSVMNSLHSLHFIHVLFFKFWVCSFHTSLALCDSLCQPPSWFVPLSTCTFMCDLCGVSLVLVLWTTSSLSWCVYQEEVERQCSYSFSFLMCIWFEFAWLNIKIMLTLYIMSSPFCFPPSFSGQHCGSR